MPTTQQLADLQSLAKALSQAEKSNNTEAQIRLYKKLLKLTPDLALAHAQLAHLYMERKDELAALPHIEHALALPPEIKVDQTLFNHLSKSQRFINNLPQAQQWFDAAPNLWRFTLLHEALNKVNDQEARERLIHQMLESELTPSEQAQVLVLLAQLYYAQARYHDSIGCYQLALQLRPNDKSQLLNIAATLEQVGRYQEAFDYYQQVLALEPEHTGTHHNLALIMLRLGEFEAGWKHHEWRWVRAQIDQYQEFSIPRWQGEPLDGKSLLVWAEQGIGDHIMFASMLNELKAMGGTLHFEIYARLDTLFQRSFSGVNFIQREQQGSEEHGNVQLFKQSWPQSDYQIPMASLAAIFRPSLESFPAQKQYLRADEVQSAIFRRDYQDLFPGKRLIGVSWRGGGTVQNDKQSRLIPMADLQILASLPNVQLIDLQYGDTREELAEARRCGVHIHHDKRVDPKRELDNQAAQISALDAVVSIDNTTVHLSGALGIATYILAPLNPCWRWGLNEGTTYWYGNAKIIRNRGLNDWKDALMRTADLLKIDTII
ncbi:hypothetical protein [Pseudomonas silesiensis]|uniref:hypothetical protein n=1 Tax=Pseudomonas silesiensis TaxID=1853130 RepID=UPI0034D55811